MKFALIYQVQLPKPWTDVSEYQLFQNILTQVSFAEEMGFEGVLSRQSPRADSSITMWRQIRWPIVGRIGKQPEPGAPSSLTGIAGCSARARSAIGRRWRWRKFRTTTNSTSRRELTAAGETMSLAVSLVEATRFPMGSPEDCIKFVEQFAAIGVEELMFNFQLGPVAHAEVMESIRLFGKQVIPYFHA